MVDTAGTLLWSHTYGTADHDWAMDVVPAGDGGYLLAGATWTNLHGSSDMWVVKVDSVGDSLWARTYGGAGWDGASAIIPSGDGNFLLAGRTWTFFEPDSDGSDNMDVSIVKINPYGDTLWTRSFGRDSTIIVQAPWGPDTNAVNFWDGAAAIVSSGVDGNFVLAGKTMLNGSSNSQMWLLKVSANGDSLWSQTYGGAAWDEATAIIRTPDQGYLLAGRTQSSGAGSSDMYLVKVNSTGLQQATFPYGGTGWDEANAIIPSGTGYLIAGTTASFGNGSADMWLQKISSNGDSLWSHTYGGIFWEGAASVITAADGGYLLAGGTSSFGSGIDDLWLVKAAGPTPPGLPVLPESERPMAMTYRLNPSRPNPFNAATILSYDLQTASQVRLKIYDTAGRMVTSLVDGWRQAGSHEVTFDASHLAAGVYLANVTAGEFTATQKLVLLK
jgi:hypothetical protein